MAARTPDAFCSLPAPRLPNVVDLDPEIQARVDRGADPLEARQLGHAPELYKELTRFLSSLYWKGEVETRTKEIARLRIARLNRCHY